jgi:hypothetical protein
VGCTPSVFLSKSPQNKADIVKTGSLLLFCIMMIDVYLRLNKNKLFILLKSTPMFNNSKLEKYGKWFAIAGLGVLVIAILTFIINATFYGSSIADNLPKELDTEKFDHFGSFVGGFAGLLFTIATTILVYLTYMTQKQELKEAREEAEASRKALELQAKTTVMQQFENTFFNLLSNHREVVNSLEGVWCKASSGEYKEVQISRKSLLNEVCSFIYSVCEAGLVVEMPISLGKTRKKVSGSHIPYREVDSNDVFDDFELEDKGIHNSSVTGDEKHIFKSPIENFEDLESVYLKTYKLNRASLGHYFRNLFHVIKFVDEYNGFSAYTDEEVKDLKYKYVRLVRAQLSNSELILIWYNSNLSFGEAFQKYINEYKLLKNIDLSSEIIYVDELKKQYSYLVNEEL